MVYYTYKKEYKAQWHLKNREKRLIEMRARNRKAVLDSCSICGLEEKLCWDHDHKTEKFRGYICQRCNMTLGKVRDSEWILIRIIQYLQASRKQSE